jgi:hypothetical protein
MNFEGKSLALSPVGLADLAGRLGVGLPEIFAVLSVETCAAGFLADRRPRILFERHIFSRLTAGQYDGSDPDVSSPIQGGYGAPGAYQYDRLAQAMALNEDAALQSTSWGIGQVMGENYSASGYPDAAMMVSAMVDGEDAQLSAVAGFIAATGLARYLRIHDWASFARGYNGSNYSANRYDIELNGFYQKYLTGAAPDLTVRAAQLYLSFRGFDPHGIDGVLGPGTRSALIAFQGSAGLSQTGNPDGATMAALLPT